MHTIRCAVCHSVRSMNGSGVRLVLGLQKRVCAGCRLKIDKTGVIPKTRPRTHVIGIDGKRVKIPQGNQVNFTSNVVHASTVGIALGYDQRYQVSPEEAEALKQTGSFSSEWRRLRGQA